MDWGAILTGLKDSLPEMGIGGVILWFLIIRENAMKAEREHYQGERKASAEHYAAELARMKDSRKGEDEESKQLISSLRRENENLESRLDHERDRRRSAEDRSGNTESATLRIPLLPPKELT